MRYLENITDENNQLRADMEVLIQLKETPEPVQKVSDKNKSKKTESITHEDKQNKDFTAESHIPFYIPTQEFRQNYEQQIADQKKKL